MEERITKPCPAIDPCIRCGVCDSRNVPENALGQLEWMKAALTPAQELVLLTRAPLPAAAGD
jgi:hypothetical protein